MQIALDVVANKLRQFPPTCSNRFCLFMKFDVLGYLPQIREEGDGVEGL